MKYLGNTFTKNLLVFIWNSDLIGRPEYLFAKSDNPLSLGHIYRLATLLCILWKNETFWSVLKTNLKWGLKCTLRIA